MKKYIVLLLAALIMLLPACNSNNTDDEVEIETDISEQIVDARLDKLLDHGWIKSDNCYTLNRDSDYSEQQITTWIEGDDLAIEISYDYGDRNEEVRELYGDDISIPMGVAARWFADIEAITGESFANLKYTVMISGEAVASGGMTEAGAQESAAEYDD